jgi:hypothetical protein
MKTKENKRRMTYAYLFILLAMVVAILSYFGGDWWILGMVFALLFLVWGLYQAFRKPDDGD